MDVAWYQTAAPAEEPVSLAEAKAHARVYTDADDDELTAFISAARALTEKATRRQLITATWKLEAPGFPVGAWFELPRPPLIAVSSITYLDLAGDEQTLSTDVYLVQTGRLYGRVSLKPAQQWPETLMRDDAVRVTYTAGYGLAAAAPPLLKQGILMRVAHWYEHREATTEMTLMRVVDGADRIDRLCRVPSLFRYPGYGVVEL